MARVDTVIVCLRQQNSDAKRFRYNGHLANFVEVLRSGDMGWKHSDKANM